MIRIAKMMDLFAVNRVTRSRWFVPLLFSLTGLLLYSNVLHAPFLFDDMTYITDNYKIKNIHNFLTDFSGTRYIAYLSFALNYAVHGLSTFGYHLVNIAIHIINAFLLYAFLQIITDKLRKKDSTFRASVFTDFIPFISALVFLVHPLQTEAVSYVAQRLASLATSFYLASLFFYAKARTAHVQNIQPQSSKSRFSFFFFYGLSILAALFAMKTKEISFTLPFIIILCDFAFFNDRPKEGSLLEKRRAHLLPYLLTLLIIPLSLFHTDGAEDYSTDPVGRIRNAQLNDLSNLSSHDYLLTQFRVILVYVKLLILPVHQNLMHDIPVSKTITEPITLLSCIIILSLFFIATYTFVVSIKGNNGHGILISFGILFFFITLSVESSVIPIRHVIFEHRTYLPSAGFILSATASLCYCCAQASTRLNKNLSHYLLAFFILSAGALSLLTYKRNVIWSNDYLLWQDTVSKSPNVADAQNSFCYTLRQKGMLKQALRQCSIAVALNPKHLHAHNNLGCVYNDMGLFDEAVKQYQYVLKLNPNFYLAYNNLGVAYGSRGNQDEAEKMFASALRINPAFPDAHYNLGIAHMQKNRLQEAKEQFTITLRLNPSDADAHYNLGNVFYANRQVAEAINEYRLTLKLNPNYRNASRKIASILP